MDYVNSFDTEDYGEYGEEEENELEDKDEIQNS